MILHSTDVPNKRITLEFNDNEWDCLVWLNANRTATYFIQWMESEIAKLSSQRETQRRQDFERAYRQADQATKDQIKTLLGL